MWEDLIHTNIDNNDDEEQQLFDDNIDDEMPVSVTLSTAAYNNFNEESGLWNFKCRSKHSPRLKDNNELRKNIIKRDQWNDSNLVRCSDGCLKGPVLFPDIPDNTGPCGSGWLKREDDDNYSENGLTIHERQRTLNIYTNFAPVKCDIHIRECYNSISKPCRILWDEGDLDCLHVLSRDTAAGDEIGWEFVSMVMNSSCTFSSYCQFKNEMYKTRHNKARFMDQTVFFNFWFSWASNMKIDYSKVETSARGTSTLFLWFCADHGHCYGFHMTGAEGRKDPALSLYSYLETPPQDVFYDFACNLQEYCLNRESGYYKNEHFFHNIFHGYSHKCSSAFTASRLQGFESVKSEICEQFNSFIQCIKRSARQMSQSHFCFYLQFFLNEWNKKKKLSYEKKIRIALAGLV